MGTCICVNDRTPNIKIRHNREKNFIYPIVNYKRYSVPAQNLRLNQIYFGGSTLTENKIEINLLPGHDIDICAAPVARDWMDASPERFAYRCLPMNIANSYGWQISSPHKFRANWDGGDTKEALRIECDNPSAAPAISHFGMGIITFHIPAVLTTPKGVALFATGPFNTPKTGASPLSGIVETDTLPFGFTMNWKLTTKHKWVTFEKGEPFCMFFPVRLAEIETFELEICQIEANPNLHDDFKRFSNSRTAFLQDLENERPEATQQKWQKDYFQGTHTADKNAIHRTALKIAKPIRKPTT